MLKEIESFVGREETYKNGPRVIDLDIILYGNQTIDSGDLLHIPHPRLHERGFVLQPLYDINPNLRIPSSTSNTVHIHDLIDNLPSDQIESLQKVIPCYNHLRQQTTYLHLDTGLPIMMGILNLTPDSFSDGGKFDGVSSAISHALALIKAGAQIIDIGGESTRPNAKAVDVEEEISRVVPVIRRIREEGHNFLISIDTRKKAVAQAAIEAGADIINDVSSGEYDPEMGPFVAKLGVPYIAMHMRGDPTTMLDSKHTYYFNLTEEVIKELGSKIQALSALGMPRWLQIVDPGIGFAKDHDANCYILSPRVLNNIKAGLGNRAMLVGLSRKRFLSRLMTDVYERRKQLVSYDENHAPPKVATASSFAIDDVENSQNRDLFTAGASAVSILGGANIIRVHNVEEVRRVCDIFSALL